MTLSPAPARGGSRRTTFAARYFFKLASTFASTISTLGSRAKFRLASIIAF